MILAPGRLDNPPPSPLNVPVPADISILPALVIISELVFKVPPKINEVKVPTLVMFGCAAVDNGPLITGAVKVPVVLVNVNPVLPAYKPEPSLNMT